MFILKLSWAQQLLWNVPEIAGSLCDNGTVPGAAIKDTLHYKTEDRKPILWQASVKADSHNAWRFRMIVINRDIIIRFYFPEYIT